MIRRWQVIAAADSSEDGMILEDMRNGGDQEAFYQEILGKMKEL